MKLDKDLRSIMMGLTRAITEARERKALDDRALRDLVIAHSLVDRALISLVARGLLDPREAEEAVNDLVSFIEGEARKQSGI